METHHFKWENPLLMAIFNSYFDITRGYLILPDTISDSTPRREQKIWASSAQPHLKGMAADLAIIVNGDIITLIQCGIMTMSQNLGTQMVPKVIVIAG